MNQKNSWKPITLLTVVAISASFVFSGREPPQNKETAYNAAIPSPVMHNNGLASDTEAVTRYPEQERRIMTTNPLFRADQPTRENK